MSPLKERFPKPSFCEKVQNWFLHKIPQLVVLSLFLIIFSFLAPLLFTQVPSFIDFTETGQIGDTLGGIMNPFIAMAGVFTTFLAFLMQYKANEQQRKQFFKSMQKGEIDEKVDCYYKLQLFQNDLKRAIRIIEKIKDFTEEYITKLNEKPYGNSVIPYINTQIFDKASNLDPTAIYKGYMIHVEPIKKEWAFFYSNLQLSLEHIQGSFNKIYAEIEESNRNLNNSKYQLFQELQNFENICQNFLHDKSSTTASEYYRSIKELMIDYNKHFHENNVDIENIRQTFNEHWEELRGLANSEEHNDEFNDICQVIANIAHLFQFIDFETDKITKSVPLYINDIFKGDSPSYYQILKDNYDLLDEALQNTDIEKIRQCLNENDF